MAGSIWALPASLICIVLAPCGCSAPAVNMGRDPDILWWTDHETGDLSDWQRGAYSTWMTGGGVLSVDTQHARSGRYALDAVASAGLAHTTSAAMLLRTGDLPQAAYYSAWFYLPANITGSDYWLIFKFRSRTPEPNPVEVELWDIDLTPQGSDLQLRMFHHTSATDPALGTTVTPGARLAVPLNRWFQVEAYFRAAPDETGELIVWQDGSLLYDLRGPSAPSTYVQWSAGSAVQSLTDGEARVFLDDAAISLRRLGPDFPVFWRAE